MVSNRIKKNSFSKSISTQSSFSFFKRNFAFVFFFCVPFLAIALQSTIQLVVFLLLLLSPIDNTAKQLLFSIFIASKFQTKQMLSNREHKTTKLFHLSHNEHRAISLQYLFLLCRFHFFYFCIIIVKSKHSFDFVFFLFRYFMRILF